MQAKDLKIDDRATFETVTQITNINGDRQIAGLYFYFMTDCIIDLAHEISKQAFSNISKYNDSHGAEFFQPLGRFRYEYGKNADMPDKAQRNEIYLQIFGSNINYNSSENSDFVCRRNDLINVAAQMIEVDQGHTKMVLKEKLSSAHGAFRQFLVELHGDSLKWSAKYSFYEIASLAYKIFQNDGIVRTLVGRSLQADNWPFAGNKACERMIAEIAERLEYGKEQKLTRDRFANLHSSALAGAVAIATVIDIKQFEADDYGLLAGKCYTWGVALGKLASLQGGRDFGQRSTQMPRLTTMRPHRS